MNNRKTPFIRYGKGNSLLETLLVRGGYTQPTSVPPLGFVGKAKAFFHKFFGPQM